MTVVGHIGQTTPLEAGIHFRATIQGAVRVLFVADDGRVVFDATVEADAAWPARDPQWVIWYHAIMSGRLTS